MRVKYNVKGVESQGDFTPVKPGLYRAKVEEINPWEKKEADGGHGKGMEVVLVVTANSAGSKKNVEGIGSKLWRYLYLDYEPTASMLREFLEATAVVDGSKGESGTLDTNKIVGTEVLVRVKSDKDQDGEYRPKIGRIMKLDADASEGEPEDEPEEEEEPESEEPEEEEGEAIDLDALDRDELKKLIKEEGLGTLADLGITKATTDDQIREIIAEKLGGDEEAEPESEEEEEEEPEPEEEPEAEPENTDGLDDLDRDGLKKLIKSEGLGSLADLGINKATSDEEIREKIRAARGSGEEPEDEAPDYDSWSPEQLKAEIQERGLSLEGRFAKSKAVKALKEDDASDSDPF